MRALYPSSSKKVVYVLEGDAGIPYPGLTFTGTGALNAPLSAEITGDPGWQAFLFFSLATGSLYIPQWGLFELGAPFFALGPFNLPGSGPLLLSTTVPNDPGLVGNTLYFQGLAGSGSAQAAFTDLESVTFIQ